MKALEKETSVPPGSLHKKLEENLFRHSRAPFGYQMVDGKYVVVSAQAEIVKDIFNMVLAGNGTTLVARELNRREIPTGTVKMDGSQGIWSASMVQGIISNEFYTGDILKYKDQLGADYAENPDDEALAPYLLKNHHEAIVDREAFCLENAVNRQFGLEKGRIRRKTKSSGKNDLTGKLQCGVCGASMKKVTQRMSTGIVYHWACTCHLKDKEACSMKRIKEETIKNSFITMVNKLSYLNVGDIFENNIENFHPLADFDSKLFRDTVLSANVTTDKKIVFHLINGLVLTEMIAPEKPRRVKTGRKRPGS